MTTQDTTNTINDLFLITGELRTIIENKGYSGLDVRFDYEPLNDVCKIELWFYNTEWSSTHLPRDMQKCGKHQLRERLFDIKAWCISLPNEADAREQALLRDYAKIKERIDASRLPEMLKIEAETLMKMMTTNIIEHKRDTVAEIEDAALFGPAD